MRCLPLLLLIAVPLLAADSLPSGARLAKGESLTSRNNAYRMDVRDDGKLAVYRLAPAEALVWESPGDGFPGAGALEMRADNDLVLADAEGATRWHSATAETGARIPGHLVLQDDGELCVFSGPRRLWAAGAVAVRIVLPLGELRKAIQDEEARRDWCVIL
ncbi:hypothetical protein [Mesoterricola silvestris]|uniref:Bulb-type lectin domain-containing protein n=1 Tax=Mesoterricola silvestris TaxID=2927979 RepID=A0AA48K9I3_9BACT|nr:hypothetical protein [Mesoterricola silvestris]BDU73100.1 hypothetical protein METEAL_22740 [Mesoterricola silvestris]